MERLLGELHHRASVAHREAWIHLAPWQGVVQTLAAQSERRERGEALPLYGVPFAVKDNIDVERQPTTAACPAFAYTPSRSAAVVERLVSAGAIVLGKTNLDQFATGLSGTRTPYGACKNPYNEAYISGGSSSGSALAVALGLCCFALGTDTAGSGRVPAALTNIVGLKPTRGALSARGVVPACRTLDCVSVFAGSCQDARVVFRSVAGFDEFDPYSRKLHFEAPAALPVRLRIGVPGAEQLEFFGDADAARLYKTAQERLRALGCDITSVDYRPFQQAAELLYDGPWVAERLQSAGELLATQPNSLHPVVRQIIEGALTRTALDAFRGQYRLAQLRRDSEAEWRKMDYLLLPTTPSTWTIRELLDQPIELNTRLGRYTNFVNLLDLAALALPSGFRQDGLPLGVTLMAPAGSDLALLDLGERFLET